MRWRGGRELCLNTMEKPQDRIKSPNRKIRSSGGGTSAGGQAHETLSESSTRLT